MPFWLHKEIIYHPGNIIFNLRLLGPKFRVVSLHFVCSLKVRFLMELGRLCLRMAVHKE